MYGLTTFRAYAQVADARYAGCFAGASMISATPTIMRAGFGVLLKNDIIQSAAQDFR
jgi:hypothetical protein